jgi:parvulin-like peptidyl-prolyl isomerase
MRFCLMLGCVLALAGLAAQAAGKPLIEIHAVVDCAASGSVRLPTQSGGCMAPAAIVKGADFTGIGHLRYGRGNDKLVVAMSAAARGRYLAFTRAHLLQAEAILIDGRVVGTPVIVQPEQADALEIAGLTAAQIDALVTRFRAPTHDG